MKRVLGTIEYAGKSERFVNLWWQYPDGEGDLFVELADGRVIEFDGASIKPTENPHSIETVTMSMNFSGILSSGSDG